MLTREYPVVLCAARKRYSGAVRREFLSHVKVLKNGCWIWTGARSSYLRDGKPYYGAFHLEGKVVDAHKAAWLLFRGEVPRWHLVCHDCPAGDDKRCVNPEHLFTASRQEHGSDTRFKGQTCIGTRNGAHKFTERDVSRIKRLHAVYGISQRALARHYHVACFAIFRIVHGIGWKHVK